MGMQAAESNLGGGLSNFFKFPRRAYKYSKNCLIEY